MERKVPGYFANMLHKCNKDGNHLSKRDCFEKLPDEVVINILSCLTLKEAAKTSVLSHRWEKLWTYSTGVLDFDGTETLMDLVPFELEELEYERVKYIDWVNQILELHQGHSIDEFRVLFDLESSSTCDINNWIEFALLKGVKRLELDLRSWIRYQFNEKFTFPTIEKLTLFAEQKMGSSLISCFSPLTAIILKYVNIAQEVVEYFFHNCPFLERLSVTASNGLENFKVSGPLLKLKYLEISSCSDITNIEISAENLLSFIYDGPTVILVIKNAPRLSELLLGGRYPKHFIEQLWQDKCYLSQLETLSVMLDFDLRVPLLFPEFKNLTRLEITMMIRNHQRVLWIPSFIGSCPLLREFEVHLGFYDLSPGGESRKGEVQRDRQCRHKCLRVVELKSFCGRRAYVELALHLLGMAVSLEKIIIDTRCRVRRHQNLPREYVESNTAQERRESAMQLKEKVPAGVRVVVL